MASYTLSYYSHWRLSAHFIVFSKSRCKSGSKLVTFHLTCHLARLEKAATMSLPSRSSVYIGYITISSKEENTKKGQCFSSVFIWQLPVALLQSPKHIDTGTKGSPVSLDNTVLYPAIKRLFQPCHSSVSRHTAWGNTQSF